jgi:hypothetical protein
VKKDVYNKLAAVLNRAPHHNVLVNVPLRRLRLVKVTIQLLKKQLRKQKNKKSFVNGMILTGVWLVVVLPSVVSINILLLGIVVNYVYSCIKYIKAKT